MPPTGPQGAKELCIAGRPEHIWANVNRPGHWNQLHEHGPGLLSRAASAIYYPATEDPSPQAQLARPACVRFYDNGRAVEVAPQPGLLVLFPTDLLHEVDPVWPGGAPRASIAFNLFVRWLDRPLLRAASEGRADEIRRLAAGGADVEEPDAALGFRAAHLAAEAGHTSALEALVRQGADTAALSREGWCPLGLAAAQGHLAAVKLLADRPQAEALENAGSHRPGQGSAGLRGARAVAAERGHERVVELLSNSSTK